MTGGDSTKRRTKLSYIIDSQFDDFFSADV